MTRYKYPLAHEIVAGVVRSGSKKSFAAEIGIPYETFLQHVNKSASLREAVRAALAAKHVAVQAEVTKEELLLQEVQELRAQRSSTRKDEVQFERVLQEIARAVDAPEPKFEPGTHYCDGRKPVPHVHNLLFSDTHYGETVDPVQVAGINVYDTAVCKRRIAAVRHSIQSFVDTRDCQFTELVINCLGDMVSGGPGIHDEIRETDQITSAEQGYEFGIILAKFVEELVPLYPKIRVNGVPGNHPRMAKPHASKNVFNNFDWVAYKVAETYLSQYPSVSCNFPKSGVLVENIAGVNTYIFHGDGIRSTMPGVPWGGVVRRINEVRKQFAAQGINIGHFQLGHFHDPNVVGTSVAMNGSLVGTNEYGLKNFGGGAPPTQLLLTWDPIKKRMTDVSFITPQ